MKKLLIGILAVTSINAFASVGDQPATPDAIKVFKASEYYKITENCLKDNYNQKEQAVYAINTLLNNENKIKQICASSGDFAEDCANKEDVFSLYSDLSGLIGIMTTTTSRDVLCKYMAPSVGYTVSGVIGAYLNKSPK